VRVLACLPTSPGRPAVVSGGSLRGLSVALTAALVAGVAAPALAQPARDASVIARPLAGDDALETVRGTVIGVERAPAPGGAPHDAVRLVVATAAETLTVALGPDWYVDAQGWAPAVGELVDITGRHVNDDRGVALEAVAVRAGDRQLVLRSADGVPSWAGRGDGHGRGRARRHQAGHVRLAARFHRGAESPSLVGVVRDASGRPVPGATVRTEPSGLTVATDEDGSYRIAALHPGRYRLVAELPSFGRVSSEPIVVDTGLEWSADFVLVAEVSEEVVVTGTRTERLLAETPVRTEIVGRQFLDTAPTRTLADAVEFTPGIRVENNCQNCNFQQVRMLGLDGAYTQILVDGLPTMSSLAMVYGIEQIPAQMIDRIEVVKGGGSSLYGSGAVGGIINIIPHEPSRTGGRVESRTEYVSGQASQMLSGGGDWVASDRQTNLTVFGQFDWVNPVDIDGDGFTELGRRELRAFGGRFGRYFFGTRAKLIVDASRIAEDRRGGNRLDLPPHEADLAEAAWMTRRSGTVGWLHFVGPRLDYRLAVSVSDMSRDSYYGAGRDPNAYGESAGTTLIVDGQVNHRLGTHAVSWGGQFIADSLADRQPAYDRDFRARYDSAGFYIQDDWSFGSWELVSGLRVDAHSALSGRIVSPRFALRWSPHSSLRVRASVGTGFRAPQVFDEDLHITQVGGEGQIIRLDPALREERSTTWTLGGEWAPEVGGGRGLLEVNAFNTRLRDLFHNVEADNPATPEAEFLKTNLGGARVYGVEVNLGWGVGEAFMVQGGFVAQRSRFDVPEPDFGSCDFLRTPRWYGTLVVTSRTAKVGDCFLGLRYTGSMKAPHYTGFIQEDRLETTRSFCTLDASLSRPVLRRGRRQLVLVLAGKNLTNAYQDDFDQGPDRDAGYVYGPRSPRSVSLAARVEF
jgi:outer membrane receptor for ferrienterochelin and colicins